MSLFSRFSFLVPLWLAGLATAHGADQTPPAGPLSPGPLVLAPDGKSVFVACETGGCIAEVALDTATVRRRFILPGAPSGLALSADGRQLLVTCAAPESLVGVIDLAGGMTQRTFKAGHTALSPVASPDGRTLYICDRFDDAVAIIDLASGRERARVKVAREPVAAALTPDGSRLFVANHLPVGRSDVDYVAASVSVVDTAAAKVVKEIALPNGSTLLRGIAVSPDGRYACVTHTLARFHVPTTQLERGWVNTNALSLIDVGRVELLNTVLLDQVNRGAANPWAVAWTSDNTRIVATHAGTHDLSIIDAPALLAKLEPLGLLRDSAPAAAASGEPVAANVPSDLAFIQDVRHRVPLPGEGPRGVAVAGHRAVVSGYFSDTLGVVDLDHPGRAAANLALGPKVPPSPERRGELLWNDARICFQGWQSCASCHSSDGRTDGLNWDLLNDGVGNPKNTHSLLLTHRTPPAMALGIRSDATAAIRAGVKYILSATLAETDIQALDRYVRSLTPVPSPHLVDGRFSPAARRGEGIFRSRDTGCGDCHSGALLTDLKSYDVGIARAIDGTDKSFDTPALVEIWRTTPYLHDGSAATLRDVVTTSNPGDRHGRTSQLSSTQISDLVAYLESL